MSTIITDLYFQNLCNIGKKRFIRKGELLYTLGCNNNFVYCVENGLFALVSITKSGKETVYQYFTEGSFINFTSSYITLPTNTSSHLFSIVARSNCWIYEIPYHDFHDYTQTNSVINTYMMSLFAKHFGSILDHLHFMQQSNVPSRLCKTLLRFSKMNNGHLIVDKHFNHVELAKYLGVHTVTISRIMVILKNEGAIEKLGHKTIIKNINLLEEYISESKLLQY